MSKLECATKVRVVQASARAEKGDDQAADHGPPHSPVAQDDLHVRWVTQANKKQIQQIKAGQADEAWKHMSAEHLLIS